MAENYRIVVLGLGYVGLPLAVSLAKHYEVVGFDINTGRIAELMAGNDRTNEIDADRLTASSMTYTSDVADIAGYNVYIVTVPTPVDAHNVPDLGAVRAASRTVGGIIAKGAIVVFESTVYPGVTEDEWINPGDREHTVERITKVLAGQNAAVTQVLSDIYGTMTSGGVFAARDIRTAEAAKVIENAQRDINIAFVNEVATIFQKMGLSIHDVLEAAGTKWNFLNFSPGLVGGHCIGVDPFYLAHAATSIGHHPEIILAGRRINDSMGGYVAECVARELAKIGHGAGARILMLGLTFKENVPDLRNSRVIDIITALKERGFTIDVHDAFADPAEAEQFYGVELLPTLDNASGYHCVIGAVPHGDYCAFSGGTFEGLLEPGGVIADIKGMWRKISTPDSFVRWQL
jgi:UDP-N-acetyl-D-galactosamine dehydrogenase